MDPAAGERVRIVLIGDAGGSAALAAVVTELLSRQGITVELARQARFSGEELLAAEASGSRALAFIVTGPRGARLYFRGPSGDRFLLRRLELESGLDEIGRELIARVVETSAVALLRSGAGVSREEARAGLAREDDALLELPRKENARKDAPPSGVDLSSSRARGPSGELGARGTVRWAGPSLGMEGAAGIEGGARLPLGAVFIRGRAAFEYGMGQSLEARGVGADLRAIAARGGVDFGMSVPGGAVSVGLGAGADWVRIEPYATDDTFRVEEDVTAVVPVVRMEARYEIVVGLLRSSVGLFADATLADTHYDVREGTETRRLATPWALRPGIALTLGLSLGSGS